MFRHAPRETAQPRHRQLGVSPSDATPQPERSASFAGEGGRLLVGVTDAPESIDALRWASSLADACRLEVHVGYAWYLDGPLRGVDECDPSPEGLESAIERRLAQIVADQMVADAVPTRSSFVHAHALRGDPAHALAKAAEDLGAGMIVVGMSRRSVLSKIRHSSVSAALCAAPPRPVAVVPATAAPGKFNDAPIVVGVDASASSSRAVQWAADVAHTSGARVVAVHAFEESVPDLLPSQRRSLYEEARERLEQQWTAPLRLLDIEHSCVTVAGEPHQVLAETAASLSAGCLVIGASESRSLRQKLFGGVSDLTVSESRHPCVVVPAPLYRPTA